MRVPCVHHTIISRVNKFISKRMRAFDNIPEVYIAREYQDLRIYIITAAVLYGKMNMFFHLVKVSTTCGGKDSKRTKN